ncbi:hypothetical protein J5N97_017240 [Dioscorea zingiberensis]|uniref:FAE domain-containing protein n=1 Tax=Dioscorea zingiberensis TaxID=325984 RepID=A0A9D5CLE0_9LILI|nr:hypothetical protein J5N97_017240 [Dioscorea zingiberensis]
MICRSSRAQGHVEASPPLLIISKGNRADHGDESESIHRDLIAGRHITSIKPSNAQGKDTWLDEGEKQMTVKHVNDVNHANANAPPSNTFNINDIEKITSLTTYSHDDKDEGTESDEGFNDDLVREIELKMENMWNENLNWEGEIKGEGEDMIDLTRDSQNESPSKLIPLEEKGDDIEDLNDPEDINKGSNETAHVEPGPDHSPRSPGPEDNQNPRPVKLKEQGPPNNNPNSEIDPSKYKWRFVNGVWNYMADSTWEVLMENLDRGMKDPCATSDHKHAMFLPKCLFRMPPAYAFFSKRRRDARRTKYHLLHIVRTYKGVDDKAYRCVYEEQDSDGNVGISLSKDLMAIPLDTLKANITTIGLVFLPASK